jgi:MFS family permease
VNATGTMSRARSRWPVALTGFTAFLDLYATQPLLPLLMRVFNATHVQVSMTVTAPAIAVAVAAPVAGRLGDLIGRKRLIVSSAWVLVAATLMASTCVTLRQLVIWRFVQGLVTPGIFGVAIAYVHDEWPASEVGRALAAYISGTVIGGFCGRLVAGLVASHMDWRMAFVALAILNVITASLVSWRLPHETRRPGTHATGHVHSLIRLLTRRRLIGTNIVGFCVLFVQVAMFSYVTFHLSAPPFSLSTAALGWLFIVYLVGAGVMPLAGRSIDRRGHRTTLLWSMAVGASGSALTLVPWLPAIVVGLALVGTGVFVAQGAASSYIGHVTQEDRGLAVGLYSTCYYLGGSAGGSLPAMVWNAGGWTACVALVLGVQVLTAILASRAWRA